jgi:hypothetical protein
MSEKGDRNALRERTVEMGFEQALVTPQHIGEPAIPPLADPFASDVKTCDSGAGRQSIDQGEK